MKDYALELVSKKTGYNEKINTLREYLQAYILRVMFDEGIFRSSAFIGGTALRFLYSIPRFSEDLDFSLVKADGYNFVDLIKKIKGELLASGYSAAISYNDEKTVHSAFIKFQELLYEAGISSFKEQKFSIKIEIDTNPPEGAVLETHIVNKYFPVSFLSYDTKSLFAGKFHALLNRKYTKGRDLFDIGWYLSRWKDISPNFKLLKNSLLRTGWSGEVPSEENWRDHLYNIIEKSDWNKLKKDVENFLENTSDMYVFSKDNILRLIK